MLPMVLFIYLGLLLQWLLKLFQDALLMLRGFSGFHDRFDAVLDSADQVRIKVLFCEHVEHFCPLCFLIFEIVDEFFFIRGLDAVGFQILHSLHISSDG